MFRIRIRQQKRPGERWHLLGDAATDLTRPARLPDASASESDQLSLQVYPPSDRALAVRVRVGSVLVASTIPADRVALIDYDDATDADAPPLVCRGRFLADWAGLTEVAVDVRLDDAPDWGRALLLPLAVSAGKLETEQLNRLFSELERDSAAVLLDVHGKTQLGLEARRPLASSAPVAVLTRLRATVRELDALLHQIGRNPASRLRAQTTREQALVGQAISDSTLAEACRDPGMLGQRGASLVFREHLRDHSRPDYRIAEHQVIADFGAYLQTQLAGLRHRIGAEIEDREARKGWRNAPVEPGQPTWWEAEDLPRIEELQRCRQEVAQLHGAVEAWSVLPFLPPGRCLRRKPQSTPLFRTHALYRRAFRVVAGHFLTYQATLDTHQLLTRARSLPVLYEWWCAVQVIRILARGLTPLPHDRQAGSLIATRLTQEGRRFTIEFAPDQALNFTDGRGARVRFRYQPVYAAAHGAAGSAVALLDAGAVRTPDVTLELYPARAASADVPEVIIVLDAKYSALAQAEKLTEVSTKYSKIGDVRTGRILSRQVWALTPASPAAGAPADGLRRYCTVDNEAFWSPSFDAANPVNGAVQTRPVRPGDFDPLGTLMVSLLQLFGVGYSETIPSGQGGE
ncbi:MAG TPA: nuclease domain-containing protein [Gemmataceae bacterium]|nr:nuclease domain-containing protein [Gemmataceae bacterium]